MWPFVKLSTDRPVDRHLGHAFFSCMGFFPGPRKFFTHETDRKPGGLRIPKKYREGKEEEFRPSGKLTKSLAE